MDFNTLSKEQKVSFWEDITNDINKSISLCKEHTSKEILNEINHYLSHNELGIALEFLANTAIEEQWNISSSAKTLILNTFKKMDYHLTDIEQFKTYEQSI